MTTAAAYAEFAARETRDVSPTYERLSVAVSRDDEVLALLGTLPPAKRQPNLLFGVVRLLGGPVNDPAAFHDYAVTNWPGIETEMRPSSGPNTRTAAPDCGPLPPSLPLSRPCSCAAT